MCGGAIQLPEFFEQHPKRHVSVCRITFQLQRLLIFDSRFSKTTHRCERRSEVVVGVRVTGVQPQRSSILRLGVRPATAIAEQIAETHVQVGRSNEKFVEVLRNGRKDKGMPTAAKMGLDSVYFDGLYAYLSGRGSGKFKGGRPARSEQPPVP